MKEEEKALSGKLFSPSDPELVAIKRTCHNLCQQLNACTEEDPQRETLLRQIVGKAGQRLRFNCPLWFNYGCHTVIGDDFFANVNFVVQDDAPVTIGDHFQAGPNVSLVTPLHPLLAEERSGMQDPTGRIFSPCYARPIHIGNHVWLAAGVIVCPGVTIGDGAVIAAGSVVTHDIPGHVLAGGVPCRVLRKITENDSVSSLLTDACYSP